MAGWIPVLSAPSLLKGLDGVNMVSSVDPGQLSFCWPQNFLDQDLWLHRPDSTSVSYHGVQMGTKDRKGIFIHKVSHSQTFCIGTFVALMYFLFSPPTPIPPTAPSSEVGCVVAQAELNFLYRAWPLCTRITGVYFHAWCVQCWGVLVFVSPGPCTCSAIWAGAQSCCMFLHISVWLIEYSRSSYLLLYSVHCNTCLGCSIGRRFVLTQIHYWNREENFHTLFT